MVTVRLMEGFMRIMPVKQLTWSWKPCLLSMSVVGYTPAVAKGLPGTPGGKEEVG